MKPYRNTRTVTSTLLLAAGLLAAVPLKAQLLTRYSSEFQFGELATNLPPASGGGGGALVYSKTFLPGPVPDVVYVTFSAQSDVHHGSALLMNASVNGVLIQPLAGTFGWYTLLKLPASAAGTNCNDGGGGSADCHDNTIMFSGCARVVKGNTPFITVTIKLANLPGGDGNVSFYENATIYIDGVSDPGRTQCLGTGV